MVVRPAAAALSALMLSVACPALSETMTVSFDPAAPVLTDGWNFGATTEQKASSSTQPGGRKFSPKKGASQEIESPSLPWAVRTVVLSAWGSGINSGNASRVTVFGRSDAQEAWTEIFSCTGLANTVAENEKRLSFTVSNDVVCTALKIAYTKDIGNFVLSSVVLSDEEPPKEAADDAPLATLDAPSNVRVGRLSDGNVRLSWTRPDEATNVRVRVLFLDASGGLAALDDDAFLFRETFAAAPATNSTVKIDRDDKLLLYTDGGPDRWDVGASSLVLLSSDAGAVRIGTTEKPGALVSKPLDCAGEGLSLVVRAKHGNGQENSGVLLNAAILAAGGATNLLGRVTLPGVYSEKAFPLTASLVASDSLLLLSEISSPKDGRIVLDEIALVRGYEGESVATNEFLCLDVADETVCDVALAEGRAYLVALAAESADGQEAWTEPLLLEASSLDAWQDRVLSLDAKGRLDARFPLEELTAASASGKIDVSSSAFRFLINDVDQTTLSGNKDIEKVTSVGVYVCTNVFSRDWIVLVPPAAETKADCEEAEMRVSVETKAFAPRRLVLSGTFAQLKARNEATRDLLFQWRFESPDGTLGAWTDFGAFSSSSTSSDQDPTLSETVQSVSAEAFLNVPVSSRLDVRVLNRKLKDQKDPPLGFCDFRLFVESRKKPLCLIVQ